MTRYVCMLAFLGGLSLLVGCGLQPGADRGVQKIERPASVVPNDLENRYIVYFDERTDYELQDDLTVEATESEVYDGSGTLNEEVVEAGKTVDVVYVHADTPSSDKVNLKGRLSFDSKIDGVIATDQAMSTANDVLDVESLSTEYPESASEQFGINLSNGQFEISGDRTSLRIDTNVYGSSDSMRVVFVE